MTKEVLNLNELNSPDIYTHTDKINLKLEDFLNYFFFSDKFKDYTFPIKTCVAQMNLIFYYLKNVKKDENFIEKHKLLIKVIEKQRFNIDNKK